LNSAEELGQQVGVSNACDALTVSRAKLYRRRQPAPKTTGRNPPPRALSVVKRDQVRQELNSVRFADQSPYQVYVALLDKEPYE